MPIDPSQHCLCQCRQYPRLHLHCSDTANLTTAACLKGRTFVNRNKNPAAMHRFD